MTGDVPGVFETLLEQLSECVDEKDFRNAMVRAAASLDLFSFAYLSLPPKSLDDPKLISNYPADWTAHYLRNRYQKVDHVIVRAQCGGCPFRWGSDTLDAATTRIQQRLFDEAAEFGICSGLTIPIIDRRGWVAAMTFAADEPNPTFLRIAERYEQALQLITTCFHIYVRRKLAGDRMVSGVLLTRREHECLLWAARGKSAWDIGCILGIKRRTAAFHLDNVRRKLGVRTIAQAVAQLARSQSLIN
jgi:LuxR family transcriptional activator of conjugal transfer of Ti plasmids